MSLSALVRDQFLFKDQLECIRHWLQETLRAGAIRADAYLHPGQHAAFIEGPPGEIPSGGSAPSVIDLIVHSSTKDQSIIVYLLFLLCFGSDAMASLTSVTLSMGMPALRGIKHKTGGN